MKSSTQYSERRSLTLEAVLDSSTADGLSLAFLPASVFASSTSTISLIVSVPIGGSSVSFTPSGGIAVAFPVTGGQNTPLVTTLSGITTTPPSSLWTITGPQAGKFIIRPANAITLTPGMSLEFIFRNLLIVADTSTPSVPIQVNSTTGIDSTSLTVDVQPLVPGVIAWADPPMVGLNTETTMRWVSNGGTKVRVIGYTSSQVPTGYKDFPVGGNTKTQVNPTLDSGTPPNMHTYQVELLAEPGGQIQGDVISVPVYLHVPYISQCGLVQNDGTLGPSITIPYGAQVTALWNCIFVDPNQGVTLAYGNTSTSNAPVSQLTFDPSSALPLNGSSALLTLTAPGWEQSASTTLMVNYEPVRILYFKYTNWQVVQGQDQLSGMSWLTDPPSTQSQALNSDPTYASAYQLQVTGPGGPFVQYLGNGNEPYLEIRYLSPSGPVKAGQAFTLQWFTNGATNLTLTTPAGTTQIASAQIAKGTSDPLTITGSTNYVLTATNSSGTSVSSYLTVTPS